MRSVQSDPDVTHAKGLNIFANARYMVEIRHHLPFNDVTDSSKWALHRAVGGDDCQVI